MRLILAVLLGALVCQACEQCQTVECQRKVDWTEPCHDKALLIATTTGSPNEFECSNSHHVIRVEVATKATREEVAALVVCECERSARDAGK